MNEYSVTWQIDVTASTPEEAARKARQYQTDPNTTATVFDVTGEDGETTRVDLLCNEPLIYDSCKADDEQPDVIDRYTVFPFPNHPDKAMRACYLGCSVGGRAVSMWGEIDAKYLANLDHLGRRVTLEELDAGTRNHIRARIKELS